jgi:hypothetical protein
MALTQQYVERRGNGESIGFNPRREGPNLSPGDGRRLYGTGHAVELRMVTNVNILPAGKFSRIAIHEG